MSSRTSALNHTPQVLLCHPWCQHGQQRSREVGRKYRDAVTVFTLTTVLPDRSWKRPGHLATTTTRHWSRPTKALYLCSTEVEAWPCRREGRKQWSTGKLPRTKTQTLPEKYENSGKKFCENTVIGYLYVNDSSRWLSHSVNCLTVHLAANSWLNLNILWLKWMHQRLRHRKVTRFALSSTSRCTSIPLMLTLIYPLALCLAYFWLSEAVKKG